MDGDPIDSHRDVVGSGEVETSDGSHDVPTTGDAAIDGALVELLQAQSGSLAERIDAGERAHRLLQGRLSDLGGA